MLAVARLHDELQLRILRRELAECAVVADFLDVAAVLGDDVEAGMVKKSAQTLRNSPTLPFLGFVAGFAVNAVSSNDRHLKSFL